MRIAEGQGVAGNGAAHGEQLVVKEIEVVSRNLTEPPTFPPRVVLMLKLRPKFVQASLFGRNKATSLAGVPWRRMELTR
jgi:hypothetical protein